MNTYLDYPTAKLLKEKGFDDESYVYYSIDGILLYDGNYPGLQPTKPEGYYDAPTIGDIVMWLYEKHGIWIVILPELLNGTEIRYYPSVFEQGVGEDIESYFNSPTEAYLEAIKYVLKNLI